MSTALSNWVSEQTPSHTLGSTEETSASFRHWGSALVASCAPAALCCVFQVSGSLMQTSISLLKTLNYDFYLGHAWGFLLMLLLLLSVRALLGEEWMARFFGGVSCEWKCLYGWDLQDNCCVYQSEEESKTQEPEADSFSLRRGSCLCTLGWSWSRYTAKILSGVRPGPCQVEISISRVRCHSSGVETSLEGFWAVHTALKVSHPGVT